MRGRFLSEHGAAIIETALTLPLLLLVAVGIFEFGRAYQTSQVLTNAAREGARVAVLPNLVAGSVDARVRDYLKMGGLTYQLSKGVGVAITPAKVDMGAAGLASASKVTVTYPFTFIVLQPIAQLVVKGTMTGAPITLTSIAVMRNETGS
jgi:Flp pilus assembly protein TadG